MSLISAEKSRDGVMGCWVNGWKSRDRNNVKDREIKSEDSNPVKDGNNCETKES